MPLAQPTPTEPLKPLAKGKKSLLLSDHILKMQNQLQSFLGDNSQVKITRSKRETKVLIKLKGNPNTTDKTLHHILSLAK